jgi:uncharacterized protein
MISDALQLLTATALGAACGALGGLFGVGGGVIAIPFLGMLYGLDQQVAQGTVLVMVVPNVLLGFWHYRRRVGVDLRMAAAIALASLAATYPVARFATGLDPHRLRLAFAAFLVGLSALVAYRTWRGLLAQSARRPLDWGWSSVVGVIGGVVSGLFGVGGAFIAPPLLTGFMALRQVEAQGLALALVCPAAVVALLTYAGAGQVDWALGVPLAVGGTAAISIGVSVAQLLPERRLRLAFCGLLTVTGGLLALHG